MTARTSDRLVALAFAILLAALLAAVALAASAQAEVRVLRQQIQTPAGCPAPPPRTDWRKWT